jgi:phosphohistidine swiveling domain-containing protein
MSDIRRVSKIFLSKAKTGRNIGGQFLNKWKTDEKRFDDFVSQFPTDRLSKYELSYLGALYNKLTALYLKGLSSSSLIDDFALGTDEIVQKEINRLLDARRILSQRGQIFSLLTAPVHQSFINKAEISLLKIALEIGSLSSLPKKIKQPKIKKMLASHQAQYFWTANNYHDNYILSVEHFIKQLKVMLSTNLDLKKELSRIKNTPFVNRRRKDELFVDLRPSRYLQNLLEISEKFTYWQDERKRRTMIFTHFVSLLLEEIGRRHGLSLPAMRYLTRAEVAELLAGRKFSAAELTARARKSIIYQKGEKYEVLSGFKADEAIRKIFKKSDNTDIQDFRGLTAATGKVRGRAKIIKSVKEVGKINPGDILIAVMTRPDYIAGIKKAAAIVTDEGGLTCHAAIIARELNIPTVIGTKTATKVLRDGLKVEVKANHGLVRIIK